MVASVFSEWVSGKLLFRKKSDRSMLFSIGVNGIGEGLTRVDVDAQNATLPAATLASGLLVHTSVTGGGTLTVDTAANLDAAFPEWQIGETMRCHYVNDGNQTVTLTGATGVTRVSAMTIATLQGATIVFLKTAASTYIVWGE
ncbi:MAG: hypothetical protein IT360_15005 [Gemmatimonadaceae bacterium]|nr:hypothetical protein [Gemmatimonadaceae bacterium]